MSGKRQRRAVMAVRREQAQREIASQAPSLGPRVDPRAEADLERAMAELDPNPQPP